MRAKLSFVEIVTLIVLTSAISIASRELWRGRTVEARTTLVYAINSGTVTVGPVSIASGQVNTITTPAPGATQAMRVGLSVVGDLTTVAGFLPNSKGNQISIYPAFIPPGGGKLTIKLGNNSGTPVTVGPLTLKWTVYSQ